MRRMRISEKFAARMAEAYKDNCGVNDLYGPLSYAIEVINTKTRRISLTPIEQLGPNRYRCYVNNSRTGIPHYTKDAIVIVGNPKI